MIVAFNFVPEAFIFSSISTKTSITVRYVLYTASANFFFIWHRYLILTNRYTIVNEHWIILTNIIEQAGDPNLTEHMARLRQDQRIQFSWDSLENEYWSCAAQSWSFTKCYAAMVLAWDRLLSDAVFENKYWYWYITCKMYFILSAKNHRIRILSLYINNKIFNSNLIHHHHHRLF